MSSSSEKPEVSDEDCNLPSEARKVLLERLSLLLGEVPIHFWAMCQICDLHMLDLKVQVAEIDPNIVQTAATLCYTTVKIWMQSGGSAVSTPFSSPILTRLQTELSSSPLNSSSLEASPRPSKKQKTSSQHPESAISSPMPIRGPSVPRSKSVRNRALTRDNSQCVITGSRFIDVAHIYPICLLQNEESVYGSRHNLWRMLRNFWPEQQIKAWENVVFPNGPDQLAVETPRNMITLSKQAHAMWNEGAFALKPVSISEDSKTLTIQFFWQKPVHQGVAAIDLLTVPVSTRALDSSQLDKLYDTGDQKIVSGDLIRLVTDDPVEYPLPSMELLGLQWFLARVMGMAGAAEVDEIWEEESSDDRISNLGLDDAQGKSLISNFADLSDLITAPEKNLLIPSIETPKHHTEDTEEREEEELVM